MAWKKILSLMLVLGICLTGNFSIVRAAVLFEDNFNSQADWTLLQRTDHEVNCSSGCNVPANWTAYYDGFSYCPGGPGHNNIYLGNTNPRGGSGKSLTYWDESCTPFFEDSDGNLGKDLGQGYNELYLRFFIRFQSNFQWTSTNPDVPQHKLFHVQYWNGAESPWQYFHPGDSATAPFAIGGIKTYQNHVWYYINYSCENTWNCQGTPSYNFDVSGDQDHIDLGPWATTMGDNQWHAMEIYFKMNSNTGSSFNKDGVHKMWLDGVLKYDSTTHNGGQGIPFSDNGSTASPRKGFRFFALGGNNQNRWTTSCTGTGCEQWYAIDDLVVSTTYIGPNYVIGAGALQGDLNGDHAVNIFDYNIFLANFGNAQCGNVADMDGNCNVNIFDYNVLLAHFGQSQ